MAGEGFHFIQNNVIEFDEVVIGGTRLWDYPGISWPSEFFESSLESVDGAIKTSKEYRDEAARERIRQREIGRLKMSLGTDAPRWTKEIGYGSTIDRRAPMDWKHR